MRQEALTNKGKTIFPLLKNFTGFYLAGGTALAMQIGHRISVDFDLFIDSQIKASQLSELKKYFKDSKIETLINNPDELTVLVDSVKITFLNYPFPLIESNIDFEGISLMNPKDIAAAKAYAIGRRGTLKDYIDLYFLFRENHTDINECITIAKQKFGREFNARLFAEQLIYLDDIEDEEIVFIKDRVSKIDIQSYFESIIKTIKL